LSDSGHNSQHTNGPSLWPIGFAIGVACLLLGLVISWIVAAIGVVLAVVFGLLWARDVTRDVRDEVPAIEPETRAVADAPSTTVVPAVAEEPLPAYTRSRFLEATTIGLGAAIGAVVTLPVLGFTVLPSFTNLDESQTDLGPIDNFPQDTYVIASYLSNPKAGEVSRRTAFVRNNGLTDGGEPSFTILYSRCVHLGCPVQPNGPVDEQSRKEVDGVELRPVLAQSFGCPCHGGLYDSEGNRRAGPPVRSLDRYTYSIKNGHLILDELYAVGNVSGTGASAEIARYPWSTPGTHVDGVEAWLYPIVPSQVTG
jgi:quinol---cytochrome c reductase iron-sulfur subunit, bacillus type